MRVGVGVCVINLLTHRGYTIYRARVEMNACVCTYVHNHKTDKIHKIHN